jgi:hypothetical protein
MWLFTIGITLANASKALPSADSCPAGRKLGALDYLGNGKLTIADACSASDMQGAFDQSCKTVSVIDEYRRWGSEFATISPIEVCNYLITCLNRTTGQIQHFDIEKTWHSPFNKYNLSYTEDELIESWPKSNGFYGYDGFYTKLIMPSQTKVCELATDEEYFKLTN